MNKPLPWWITVIPWIAFIAFIMANTGCLPKEVRDWNREHPPCSMDDCGKTANLAPRSVVAWHNYSEADKTFFGFMESMVPGENPNKVIILPHPHDWKQRAQAVSSVVDGGFLIIRGNYGDLERYFSARNWQRLPFYWRKYQIWRKPPFYRSSQHVQSAG